MQFALTYAPNVFDTRGKLMGRQSAGLGFLRAALEAQPERIWCYALNRQSAELFGRDAQALSSTPPELRFIPWSEPAKLAQAGLLYRADPGIGDDAWRRQQMAAPRSYSLCGVTHTLSSQGAMTTLANLPLAPLYSWDALICTSTVARDVTRALLETQIEHLRARLGATRFTLPQLPMIPLGVHGADFVFSADQRTAARAALQLGPDDVAALFVGRLSFHAKAHPMPMFLGLEQAAQRTGKPISLILFGQAPSEAVASAFESEARRFAPSVRLLRLDGADDLNRERAWAAADLFTSLSDNIQETFGLTPLEAMAAGLPVVVSDWDGYKDTVRDGVDGFRVATHMPPPGAGAILADRFDQHVDNYDVYVGSVSQFVAVDVEAAADAYEKLVADPELRRRMGAAGRRRVAELFDWRVVFRRYQALWEELAERRRADPNTTPELANARRPDRPDPFALFRTYPTRALSWTSRVRLRPGIEPSAAGDRRVLASVNYSAPVLPPEALVAQILATLENEAANLSAIAAAHPDMPRTQLFLAIAWLLKMGIVTLEPEKG
ncbi:Glycosyl transferases group 1 [Bosea sp. CRIB-10]|uniref:glycosyltransferase family 4 protein n=1 Tax=Bosea sp. CRIB-10 TaxID=378404 RepID=UPI0008EDB142|nr:glycosyltransferase family 4 protein [Bosea sp. CRIB-10]SFD64541.1 Glycosyl transferases group 1 [Bosea sp. CRIB-10]